MGSQTTARRGSARERNGCCCVDQKSNPIREDSAGLVLVEVVVRAVGQHRCEVRLRSSCSRLGLGALGWPEEVLIKTKDQSSDCQNTPLTTTNGMINC